MRPMFEHRRPWSHTFQKFLKIYQNVYKKYYDLRNHFSPLPFSLCIIFILSYATFNLQLVAS